MPRMEGTREGWAMRSERWMAATVVALCVVVALLGKGLAETRLERMGAPNPWAAPK